MIVSILFVTLFEYLALMPYLLRSLRIKKIFQAREEYMKTKKIPRELIENWFENRVLKILTLTCIMLSILSTTLIFLTESKGFLIDSLQMNSLFDDKGKLLPTDQLTFLLDSAALHFLTGSTVQFIVLLYALHEQWSIEKDYSIFREILIVTCFWGGCNQLLTFIWVIHPNWI